jgi:hypothetical protein
MVHLSRINCSRDSERNQPNASIAHARRQTYRLLFLLRRRRCRARQGHMAPMAAGPSDAQVVEENAWVLVAAVVSDYPVALGYDVGPDLDERIRCRRMLET